VMVRGCKDDEGVLCMSERKSSEGVFELVCEMNESVRVVSYGGV
jgi:hypothetical protein